jgi:long-subunit acyl-CoA synthetase (AMP-forming)
MTSKTPNITIHETPQMAKAKSFLDIFYLREELHPDKVYLRQPQGNNWTEYTWKEVGIQARKVLTALRDLGLEKGDHIGIISKNCAQWIIADLAILMGGFVSVPFYPTLTKDELQHVIGLSDIKALFVGKLETWDKQKDAVPEEMPCIAFPHYEGNSKVDCKHQWQKILDDYAPTKSVHIPKRSDIFTIIYTSGTTGTPKGVMLNYECVNQVILHERANPSYGIYQGVSERVLSYLPLNHIAERIISEVSTIVAGSEVSFSESLEKFASNLQSVQPTQFFAVPRIWVKIQQGILAKLPQQKLDFLLKIPIVKNIIKNKIKDGIGLGQVRSAISGAAPVSAELLDWYKKLDIHIQEVYGATELCGGVTFNAIDEITTGTVGKPLYGTDIKIDPETDEVLVCAPWVMLGYYKAEDKTREVMDGKYYRTGDTGRFDDKGNLIITGRIKDTFKTAKGKFVVPVPLEHHFSSNSYIEQVMITGIGLVQPIALISLNNPEGVNEKSIEEGLLKTLEHVNSLSDKHEQIKQLVVFRQAWTEDSGFFTPTMKIKRHIVDAKYKESYFKWEAMEQTIIWLD